MSEPADAASAPLLSPADLLSAGRALAPPFRLTIQRQSAVGTRAVSGAENCEVECLEVLRLLPGRRLVARARLGDAVCVIKLFFGRGARRYFERERRGLQRLVASEVPTPELLGAIALPDGAGFGLLLEWLADAEPVAEDDPDAFVRVVGALAHLHNGRAIFTDPHLNNYLKTADGRVFAVDGDSVRWRPVLSRWQALANLGLLLAQYPPAADGHLLAACAEYDRIRWQTSLSDVFLAEMRRHLRRQRRRRSRRYLAKTLRECSQFHCERAGGRFVVCERAAWDPAMAEFATDPEALFVGAEVLKAGNSATVVRACIGQQTYVIKRYNVKTFAHGLRRTLQRLPRYRRAWRNAHRMELLRLPSASAVALVECRIGPLATRAYLVMEDLGPDVVDLATRVGEGGVSQQLAATVADLFAGLAGAELVHGDTKASNFMVRDEDVYLIDLDAMRQARRGLARDVSRFLTNWESNVVAREQFHAALQAAGMPL